jgi:uncharacterized protein (DUF433 family)
MTLLLNSGIYDVHEVAHLLAVDAEQVVRWATPDAAGRPAIVLPTHGRSFSFVDLVTMSVVVELRSRGVADRAIRHGVAALQVEYHLEQPLAHRAVLEAVGTSGRSFVARLSDGWVDIGEGRQGAFDEVIAIYFTALSYDALGVADSWHPSQHVSLDPRIQAGAPCISGTRIPTATIAALLESESADELATEYGLTVVQVEAAEAFEQRLNERFGLVA